MSLRRRVPRKCLHLFAGRPRTFDLAYYLGLLAWESYCVDVVRGADQENDLLDDATWARLEARLEAKEFGFVFAGTPCSTHSAAREHPPGPRVVRSLEHPM